MIIFLKESIIKVLSLIQFKDINGKGVIILKYCLHIKFKIIKVI